ncbi:CotO family spore coat protein, partial [Bacillus haynesii]
MSSRKNDAEQKPLMYIVQPDYDKAEANMQDILIKRKKKAKPDASEQKALRQEQQDKAARPDEKADAEAVLSDE